MLPTTSATREVAAFGLTPYPLSAKEPIQKETSRAERGMGFSKGRGAEPSPSLPSAKTEGKRRIFAAEGEGRVGVR